MAHSWCLNIIYSITIIITLLKRLAIQKMSELKTGMWKTGQKLKWRKMIKTNLLMETLTRGRVRFCGKALSKCRCPERGLLEGQLVITSIHWESIPTIKIRPFMWNLPSISVVYSYQFLCTSSISANVLLFESFLYQIYWVFSKYIQAWNFLWTIIFIDKLTVSEKQSETLNRCFKNMLRKVCFPGSKNKVILSQEYFFSMHFRIN